MNTDEREQLEAWRGGDVQAGERLFRRHFDAVYWFFATKVDYGADDLAQETFAAVLRQRDRSAQWSSFRAYLFAVARSKLIDRFRARGSELDPLATSVADLGITPSAELGREQANAMLVAALRLLPIDLQVALELHYFEELRGPEMADALQVPEGTVRSRLRRALAALREQLGEEPDQPPTIEGDLERWAADVRGRRASR